MRHALRKSASGERPAERGAVHKVWQNRIRIGLLYPNRYALAMSNLGYQSVYRLFNAHEDVVCERLLPEDPMRPAPAHLLSLESGRPPGAFDILAFSLAFENDYPHVLALLQAAGLPLRAAARHSDHPLVVAGGVAVMLNPEPLAPFFDLFLIGEGEALVAGFLDSWRRHADRRTFLRQVADDLPGAYVPAFYTPVHDAAGRLTAFHPRAGAPTRVHCAKAAVENLETSSPILSAAAAFPETCLVEVSRGCPHGCRFCSAGFVYRPPRFRDPGFLEAAIRHSAADARQVGLVGAAVSDYPHIGVLSRRLADTGLRLSFSSLRADALDEDLLAVLRANRTKTATIAPEAGSQRLRDVINKGLCEADILAAAERLVTAGIPNLKLYFLVGLPTETAADIAAIVALCRRIRGIFVAASRPRGRIGSVTVSVTPFVPKPATPFQWAAMEAMAGLKRKLQELRRGIQPLANFRLQTENLRAAYIQALLARGDRRVAALIERQLELGGNWAQALKQAAPAPDFYVTRERPADERLPWDFIDTGTTRDFLWREYQRALEGQSTPPCPAERRCQRCGACDPCPPAPPSILHHPIQPFE
jgi:radical SAM superfamily enzyme YgiQ (UPF0313 family)